MVKVSAGFEKPPVVVERWRLGEDIAEVATFGGKSGWRVTLYRRRDEAWHREVRSFPTSRGIPDFLKRRGFEKCERGSR